MCATKKGMNMNLTQKQLSRRWNIGASTVSKLLAHPDAPQPGKDGRYNAKDADAYRRARLAMAGRLDGDTSMAEIRRKQEARKLELLDIQVRKARGELIEREEVRQIAMETGAMIRTAMAGMPNALAPQLLGMTEPEAVRSILDDWARTTALGWAAASGNEGAAARLEAP